MSETVWALRAAEATDEAFLENLYMQAHAADFTGLPDDQVSGLLRMQARAQRLGYLRDFPTAQSCIVVAEAAPIGRLLVDYGAGAIHLVDIALLPEWQGRGIGKALLQNLKDEARKRSLPLQLAVRPGNPALQMYSRLGFSITSGGMQLGMEWTPESETASRRESAAGAALREDAAAPADDVAALYPRLVQRRFQLEGGGPELVLDHVQRHLSSGGASFSLFFHGTMEPVLTQGLYTLHLLDAQGVPEREFLIFLVPVGPAGDAMEYEAVFNL